MKELKCKILKNLGIFLGLKLNEPLLKTNKELHLETILHRKHFRYHWSITRKFLIKKR